ncbi:MAG: hypothetical protein ACD_10C00851G0003 [uncultured bacterium]|nr:MAG: hypothetical protein ACD_10C00851G0003 [uncultured bacterium]
MRHIGNRHHQAPAAPLFLAEHRVIEIARRFTVNRHQGQFTQILAPGQISLPDLVRQRLVFVQHGLGKLKRQIVLAQGNLDFHARIGIIPQHFGNPPDRL